MLRIECDFKMYVRNLQYILHLPIGNSKTPFSTTSQLNGKFNGLSSERNMICISGKMSRTLVHTRLKLNGHFHAPSVNSTFYFTAKLNRLRSANEIQANFAKRWTVNRASNQFRCRKVRVVPPENWGQKLLYLFGFRRLWNLVANIF